MLSASARVAQLASLTPQQASRGLQGWRLNSRWINRPVTRAPAKQTQRTLTVMSAGDSAESEAQEAKNVLGGPLECCCTSPVTGFSRDGYCRVTSSDFGVHAVCAQVTEKFLEFTKTRGNDLSTPRPPGFPGLKPGDRWCLCAARWKEAHDNGVAPKVVLASTDAKALEYIPLELLQQHAA